jgi:hypothetical protein
MCSCLRRGISPVLPALLMGLMLGGCSTERFSDGIQMPNVSNFEWNPYSRATTHTLAPRLTSAPASAADYVNADGSCAGGEESAAAAVALQMTECALVRVLGAPERIDIASNDRGERTAKLLYGRGDRPGLYHFTAGRLTQIERVAEPAPPPRPQRQPAKRRTT